MEAMPLDSRRGLLIYDPTDSGPVRHLSWWIPVVYPAETAPVRPISSGGATYMLSAVVRNLMSTGTILQAFTAGMVLLGLLGITASYVPAVPFPWTGQEAFLVGTGLLSIGFVMFADLRRRNWGEPSTGKSA